MDAHYGLFSGWCWLLIVTDIVLVLAIVFLAFYIGPMIRRNREYVDSRFDLVYKHIARAVDRAASPRAATFAGESTPELKPNPPRKQSGKSK